MDRRTVVGCSSISRRRRYKLAEWHTLAADRCADCADNNDISSVSLSPFSTKMKRKSHEYDEIQLLLIDVAKRVCHLQLLEPFPSSIWLAIKVALLAGWQMFAPRRKKVSCRGVTKCCLSTASFLAWMKCEIDAHPVELLYPSTFHHPM